ncbi:MAG: AMP-binding protein [Alphaproteobacteria bacterium]|nr:AMP-binding protein [Alphaproteobacteria bacterium]OJV11945.1 MAG: hypothetical protein BGO27_00575 [Alphaproteobacteria bacterium 33-17]
MNLYNILQSNSSATTAIIHHGLFSKNTITYKELEEKSNHYAKVFKKHGIRKNDIIVMYIPITIELYAILSAILKLGAVVTFIEPSASKMLLEHYKQLKPKAIVTTPTIFAGLKFLNLISHIPLRFTTGFTPFNTINLQKFAENESIIDTAEVDEDHPAIITFTSGSSGIPKAIIRSHGFLLNQHKAIIGTTKPFSGVVDMISLPIFILSNLGSAITTVIPKGNLRKPANVSPKVLWEQIKEDQVSRLTFPPIICGNLADYAIQNKLINTSVKHIFTGGGPVYPSLLKKLRLVFASADIIAIYGSTEAEPIADLHYREIKDMDFVNMNKGKGVLVGNIVEAAKVKIINFHKTYTDYIKLDKSEFDNISCKQMEFGEIVVSGNNVVKSYVNAKDNLDTKFSVDGEIWHRTGDSGYIDPLGRLWLLGRYKQIINFEGKHIHPFSVECAANSYDIVKNAALVMVDNKRILAVETYNKSDLNELKNIKKEINKNFGFDVVEYISVTEIPMDKRHNSKVDYTKISKTIKLNKLI